MNPLAQVRHVMAKDISQARWTILLYLTVVALATAHALGWTPLKSGAFDIAMYMVVLAGLIVTANVVQADSPIRSDAFWASRPIHPAALLGAKALLVALLVLGVPLIGQAVVLFANEVPGSKFVRLVTESVWVYGVWLLIAMLVGALTRDLKSFTTTLIGAPVVILLMNTWSMFMYGGTSPAAVTTAKLLYVVLLIVGVGGAGALLLALYRTRTAGKLIWVGAIVAVLALFATVFAPLPPSAAAMQRDTVANAESELFIEFIDYPNAPPQLTLGVARAVDSDRLVMLDSVSLKLRLADGATVDVPYHFVAMPLTRPKLLDAGSWEWLGPSPYTMSETRTGVQISRRQAEELRKGVVSATLEGKTWSAEPRVLFTMPFSTGETMRRDGRTVRIVTASRSFDDSLGVVSISTIDASRTVQTVDESRRTWGTPQYVLMNQTRRQAFLPNANVNGSASQSLVLPGAWRSERRSHFRWHDRTVPFDDAWLGNAVLAVLDWKPVGNATISVKATVRPPERLNEDARRQSQGGTAQGIRSLRIRSP